MALDKPGKSSGKNPPQVEPHSTNGVGHLKRLADYKNYKGPTTPQQWAEANYAGSPTIRSIWLDKAPEALMHVMVMGMNFLCQHPFLRKKSDKQFAQPEPDAEWTQQQFERIATVFLQRWPAFTLADMEYFLFNYRMGVRIGIERGEVTPKYMHEDDCYVLMYWAQWLDQMMQAKRAALEANKR